MAKIPLSLMSWELDTNTGIVTATFADAPSDTDPDPVSHTPVETHVIQFSSAKREVFKWPRNERAARAREDNSPPA